jgi:hypothetical protein
VLILLCLWAVYACRAHLTKKSHKVYITVVRAEILKYINKLQQNTLLFLCLFMKFFYASDFVDDLLAA